MTLHPDIERVALLGWRMTPATRSKKGLFKGYLGAATSDLDTLEGWAREYPGCNWKVVPEGSGVFALDVDVPGPDHTDDGVATLRALCEQHGAIPARPHGRSGGGGHLLVFKQTAPVKPGSGHPAPGLDTCAGRVAFTISPSIHRSGGAYRWHVAPWELNPPPAPDWLLKMVAPPPEQPRPERPQIITENRARQMLARTVDEVIAAGPGRRNASLNRAAFVAGGLYGSGALDQRDAVFALFTAGRHIGLTEIECRATIRSGFEAGQKRPIGGATHA